MSAKVHQPGPIVSIHTFARAMGTQREGTGKRRKNLGPPFALLLTPRTQRRVGFKYWKWKLPPANKIIVTRSVPGDSVIGAITRLLLLRALPLRVVAGGAFVRHAFGAFYATKLPNLPQFLPLPVSFGGWSTSSLQGVCRKVYAPGV